MVYCHPPPGYERVDDDGHRLCCKVVKPIYGMAQAGRRWQRTLFPWLKQFGFTACDHDACVFRMSRPASDGTEESLILGVYVDDLAVAFSRDGPGSLYSDFVSALRAKFEVEDEGELSDLLGIDFSVSGGVVSLTQTKYIERLVATFLRDGVPPDFQRNKLPYVKALPDFVREACKQDPSSIDPLLLKRYQRVVGALLYCATNTRPDVAYAVGQLSRAMSKPTPDLEESALRVIRYLYRTRTLGLRYEADARPLHGYSDSDWAVQHSTSGWVFVLNQAAVSWGSKKQKSVALSSCEAEIVAASEASKEAVHLRGLAQELGYCIDGATDLHMDNRSAIDVAYNPEHHTQMKHVDRRHFYVRELVEEHILRCPFVSTHDNLADFFTKALPSQTFFPLRDAIMNVHPSQRERDVATGGR